MSTMLIVDDDPGVSELLERLVLRMGMRPLVARTVQDALKTAPVSKPDIIMLDVMLPDGSGLQIIPALRRTLPDTDIIVMTGAGDVESAEKAIRDGAWTYIVKQGGLSPYTEALERLVQYRAEKQAPEPFNHDFESLGIIGKSAALKAALELASSAARTDASVVITGETGTGKELLARAIHAFSRRAENRFTVVDCTALPSNQIESTLFGAASPFGQEIEVHPGLIRAAHLGTLFMDEVGELPPHLQAPFLRVLQEHTFTPVGSNQELHSDFRLITATRQDPGDMVAAGTFRQDLLYRIRAIQIHLPPLRDRTGDIPAIAEFQLRLICARYGLPPKDLSEDCLEMLGHYDWPGNIRELMQALERAISAGIYQSTLFARHLPQYIQIAAVRRTVGASLAAAKKAAKNEPLLPDLKTYRRSVLERAEREYLEQLLQLSEGNAEQAQECSGLSVSELKELLEKHGLTLGSKI